jgi:hypothetical protein
MEHLDVRQLLEFARAAVAVIRSLQITDRTMRYGEACEGDWSNTR